ncbi:YihY/virulence factor BrkB family protein [Paractinoplanes hotanensis]|uniref:YihY/virulence factor BrkB family protein n=1 Tax=Paractinoplanes hotanensis TaxID=2906497 RepID=A0ABT0YCX1_9ACTN|nr:YihY/virulence factor BrkB family protein [Actinoplanes hotanensis]MCM4083889.1 YihY/virulence factor BrkB family protein [Actinoplanes hotanensis]
MLDSARGSADHDADTGGKDRESARRRDWWTTRVRAGGRLAARTARKALHDRLHGLAAEASFWTMLSLPPLLLALLTLVGPIGAVLGEDLAEQVATAVLGWAGNIFTESTVRDVVQPLVTTTLREGDSGILSLSLLVALWSGSAALSNYLTAITVAYDMDGLRSFWRTRLLSLVLYVAALLIGAVLLPLLIVGPGILARLLSELPGPDLTWLITVAYWPTAVLLSLIALTSLYHLAVPVKTRWTRDLPGAVLALAIWIGGSAALRAYLSSGLRSDAGPIGAPIAFLLFFFLTALAVLVGAELNAAIDESRPDASTRAGRQQARRKRESSSDASS